MFSFVCALCPRPADDPHSETAAISVRHLVLSVAGNRSHLQRLRGGVDRATQGKCHHVSDFSQHPGMSAAPQRAQGSNSPRARRGQPQWRPRGREAGTGLDSIRPETPRAGASPTLPLSQGGGTQYTGVRLVGLRNDVS